MEWSTGIQVLALLVGVGLVGSVGWLIWRSRRLRSGRGSFECYRRPANDDSPHHWSQGIARYRADALCWYPLLAFSLTPKCRFGRLLFHIGPQRSPTAAERAALFEGQQIVALQSRAGADLCDLAMSPSAMTGLLAWIEAAPPGEGQYGHTQAPGGGTSPDGK